MDCCDSAMLECIYKSADQRFFEVQDNCLIIRFLLYETASVAIGYADTCILTGRNDPILIDIYAIECTRYLKVVAYCTE